VITQEGSELDPEERRICSGCIGELFLASRIEKFGRESICSYCGDESKTFSIMQMADAMEKVFEQHFYLTANHPTEYQSAMMEEDGWYRDGDKITDVIAMCAEIQEEPAEDIQSVLAERHYDEELARMSEESPFDEEAHYAQREIDDADSKAGWRQFEESLRTRARFFNRTAEERLRSIFEDLSAQKTTDGRSVIVEAGPETQLSVVYRARVFQSYERLEEALKRPDEEIGPPPAQSAVNGRMNAHGIAVFYGATDPMIALAEVRPPVGSNVVIGRFEIIRPLRLLDIQALQSVYADGSLFDPDYARRLERAKFLRWLGREITQPIMPNDEPFGYLATQAIADFLATDSQPPLDGILFPSVQGGEGKLNLVLFHKASRVIAMGVPNNARLSVISYGDEDAGDAVNYTVWEEVPKNLSAAERVPEQNLGFPLLEYSSDPYVPETYDDRELTLRLDISTLQVHRVSGVKFTTLMGSVDRHRIEKQQTELHVALEPAEDLPF
jgi:RES domain/HEPN/RES N-terminal domain 1